MALVQLLHPTDMSTIPQALAGVDNAYTDGKEIDVFATSGDAAGASARGAFDYAVPSNNPEGTITEVLIDTADFGNFADFMISGLTFQMSDAYWASVFSAGHLFQFVSDLMTGKDHVIGTSGPDTLLGFGGNDILDGKGGFNRFEGGPGGDRLNGGPGQDQAQYTYATSGVVVDLLHPGQNKGEAKGDTFHSIENIRGSSHSDTLRGNNGANSLGGGAGGSDKLFGRGGNDTLATLDGNDLLDGGPGKDNMSAGGGADRFDFNSIKDSVKGANRDIIQGFSHSDGDHIDLSTIDANTAVNGNQKFVFIGADTFAHYHAIHHGVLGMIRLSGNIVQGNVDAKLGVDFEIYVISATTLVAGDFIL